MDRLLTMTTFVKVVKHASFTVAADELGISRTLVSRHIADLEAHLGVRLLHRTTRSVTPTSVGQQYSEFCERILMEIEAGEEEATASKNEIEGEISVLCPIWVGSFGVSEATAEFSVRNPNVHIRLEFSEPSINPHDFLDRGFDICIQPTTLRDSSVMVKKIGDLNFVLAAAPAYLEENEPIVSVADLFVHEWLAKQADSDWHFANGEKAAHLKNPRFTTNSVFSLCTAAVAGLGIAMLPEKIAERDIQMGALRPVLADVTLKSRPLYVSYPPGGNIPRRVTSLIDFLARWFQKLQKDQTNGERVLHAFRRRNSN